MENFWSVYDLKHIIKQSSNREIRIAAVARENTAGIDIRTYYKKYEVWHAGKGLVIPLNKWEEFQKVISNLNK